MKCLPHTIGAIILLTISCSKGDNARQVCDGDTIRMKYAENIAIIKTSSYTKVELKNPWKKGEILHTYILVDRSFPEGERGFLPTGTTVATPLQKSVVFNTSHASLIQMLGALDAIKGVADSKYMQLPEIKYRLSVADRLMSSSGESLNAQANSSFKPDLCNAIFDCGDAMAPDVEMIIDIEADAVLLSPLENSGGYGKLEKIGVPIIECCDYMETSALGRAEWMRFYGMLYGKEHEADSLFAIVEQEYMAMVKEVSASKGDRNSDEADCEKSILTEKLIGQTWFVPGGQSNIGKLIVDACGKYAWADDKHSGSLALSFEAVLDKAGDSDIWLFCYSGKEPITYEMLAGEFHGYSYLKAFRNHNVFYVNPSQVPYFEEIPFRPDWLLKDYITLLHPDLGHGQLRYFKRIEDE